MPRKENSVASSTSQPPADAMDIDADMVAPLTPHLHQQQQQPPHRIDVDMAKKEKSLAEFVAMLDDYAPIIPDPVTDYYLQKSGFNCDDIRIKRLLALAAQKFVSDVAADALHFSKLRQQGTLGRRPGREKKLVLTMEDLTSALSEYGVNVKKPEYYS